MRWECVWCLKACWEKREHKNGWRKQAPRVGVGGENITRTEPGCKCLRTCPLPRSEWQREIEGGERSENAFCTHWQRRFNTLVRGQGAKTRTHMDSPLSPCVHTHAFSTYRQAKPQNRPFLQQSKFYPQPYIHEKTRIVPGVNDAYPCLFIKSCSLQWIATQRSIPPLLLALLTLLSPSRSSMKRGKSSSLNDTHFLFFLFP